MDRVMTMQFQRECMGTHTRIELVPVMANDRNYAAAVGSNRVLSKVSVWDMIRLELKSFDQAVQSVYSKRRCQAPIERAAVLRERLVLTLKAEMPEIERNALIDKIYCDLRA